MTLVSLFKRTIQLILLSLLLTSATFLLSSLIPGDFFTLSQLDPAISETTVEGLRQRFGLDQPVYIQYVRWLLNSLHLDFGYSLFYQRPVAGVVADALGKTLWMGFPAFLLGLTGGALLGTFHAVRRERLTGQLLDAVSSLALSLPTLVLGIGAMFLAARTGWFPLGSMSSLGLQDPSWTGWLADRIHHLILPVACLTIPVFAYVERIQYAAAADALEEDYVRAARARGLGQGTIFIQYLLRPSLNPVLSTSGPLFGAVLSGSLVLEIIFAWPGLGQITYDALYNRDLFLLVGCVMGSSVLLVAGNLLADLLLLAVDPRTRPAGHGAMT